LGKKKCSRFNSFFLQAHARQGRRAENARTFSSLHFDSTPILPDLGIEMKERGDFTADRRLIWLSILAVPVGIACAFVAMVLQRLIGFFTNVFYYQSLVIPTSLVSPAHNTLGWWAILVPVVGGLIIGLMARYGSDRIRGHGIPEAMEAILIGQSRMQPRVAVLKPLSSAISIGSGGPFGAEGPIIMTGGAFGSIFAQIFHMSSAERKTLLVAGAAGGMAATFGTPVAAVLLAVELLLFELKPRSLVPVALASASAAVVRMLLSTHPWLSLGRDPLFSMTPHHFFGAAGMISSIGVGLTAGCLSLLLTVAVYAAEDAFQRMPIHWMWWPALGGLAVGIGGLVDPRALGVGYDLIEQLLGNEAVKQLLVLMIVKCLIWAIALGSGTSGGVLAPLLIMGGALGALESRILPEGDASAWALIGMAAVMGGTMRSPLTGTLFAMELTYDVHLFLPVLCAAVVSHAFTVLSMKRSILTEKVARRGYHISREYTVDPLEILSVGEVMTRDVVSIPASMPVRDLLGKYFFNGRAARHQGFPVVDKDGKLCGVITRSNLLGHWFPAILRSQEKTVIEDANPIITYDLIEQPAITAFAWESCRTAAERMAEHGVGRLPVVEADDARHVTGIVTRSDLLKGRARYLEEEHLRERFIGGPPTTARERPAPTVPDRPSTRP
jgi:H+/Cl- antiporter ClcA/predicted transcriptional regulator